MGWSNQPLPGRPVLKSGQPYIWVTWLAKLLGGHQCLWSAWFKAHYKYAKHEEQGELLAEWNREHTRLMRSRRQELEEAGYLVTSEEENEFKVVGRAATVAGKPDLIARRDKQVLVVDGKTGRQRDSDIWQVLIYLWALPISRPDIVGDLEGEVHYKQGDERLSLPMEALTPDRVDDLVTMVKTIAAAEPPAKAPSRYECQVCNITAADCPERFRAEAQAQQAVSLEAGF